MSEGATGAIAAAVAVGIVIGVGCTTLAFLAYLRARRRR